MFWEIKNINKKPASSVFHKIGLFVFSHILIFRKSVFYLSSFLGKCGHIYFFINNGLDERPNDAYNWPGETLFWIATMYFN